MATENINIGAPEDVMNTENLTSSDALTCLETALYRALGTTTLLATQFESEDRSRCNDLVLSNVIWAIQGQIEQAIKLADVIIPAAQEVPSAA